VRTSRILVFIENVPLASRGKQEGEKMLQIALIIAATLFFFILERVLPGRELPEAPGWYFRAAFLNACQIGLILLAGAVWDH
jgi:hypothetical protein